MKKEILRRPGQFKRHIRYRIYQAEVFYFIALICFASLSSAVLPPNPPSVSELMKLISENEDDRINVNDLAFLLVVHDFDAKPVGRHVELNLNGTIYNLVPNGQYPGLANITIKS